MKLHNQTVGWLVDFLAIWLVSYEPSEDQ